MGFDSKNLGGSGKPTKYLKIVTEQDDKKVVLGKFFAETAKVDGSYVDNIMKNQSGYPLPFFGYLRDIKLDLENTIKKSDGTEIPAPKIKFSFVDDESENYVLDLGFTNDKGKVTPTVSTLLNSLAGINEFGYIKLYINPSVDKKGVKVFNLNLRNHTNWVNSGKNYKDFMAPQDGSPDVTRVSWRYQFNELPPIEIEKEIDGEVVKINNSKKHRQFYIDIVNDLILPKLKENTNHDTYSSKKEDNVAEKPAKAATTFTSEDTDDLPF